jgi:hypothetical protein
MVTVFSPATRGRPPLLLLLAAASYRKVGEVKLGTVIGGGLKGLLKHNWKNPFLLAWQSCQFLT